MRLVPCPHCDHHAWSNERTCPHCGGTLEAPRGRVHHTAAAVLLGLAACTSTERPPAKEGDAKATTPKKEPPAPIAEPEYGIAEVPIDSIPEAPAYGGPPTEDIDVPEAPAYGDPITDIDEDLEPPEPVAEPEYGVPISATPM